ncbi:MAG: hypothetical protein JWR19_3101 [Pedosphaera sp.]|nr:hypothetical protein [Pedosphaera sp.]
MSGARAKTSGVVLMVAMVWFIGAVVAGYLRWLEPAPRVVNQIVLVGLTVTLLVAFWKVGSFREWVLSLPMRVMILFHVVRFVGFYFLILYRRGELPFAFAVPGGVGDILVATTALVVAGLLMNNPFAGRVVLAWNLLGAIDILLVVISAARFGLADPGSMVALTRLPLSLLPTFIVPLIIFSHAMIFYRLSRSRGVPVWV